MNRREKLKEADNYVLYYGNGLELELGSFDITIIEPSGQTEDSLKMIRKSGTLIIAYLSVMEIASWEPEFRMLKREDFLFLHDEPYINPEYGNYWMDLRSASWCDLLDRRVKHLLCSAGYDGLFLDTIGYVEAPFLPPDLRTGLCRAAVRWLQKLRSSLPEHLIIQNGGLMELCHYTGNYVNGFTWENPPLNNLPDKDWVQEIIAKLALFRRRGHKIFFLWENPNVCLEEARQLIKNNGFLAYWAPGGYAVGINPSRINPS